MSDVTLQRNVTVKISAIQDDLVNMFVARGWVKLGEIVTITPGNTEEDGPTLYLALGEVDLDKKENTT